MKNLAEKYCVEQWPVRTRRAKKRMKELASIAGISATHLSQIINGHIQRPKDKTLNKVESVLISWKV
jgi:transcriptional regulator with XRE-family HTH domain